MDSLKRCRLLSTWNFYTARKMGKNKLAMDSTLNKKIKIVQFFHNKITIFKNSENLLILTIQFLRKFDILIEINRNICILCRRVSLTTNLNSF